MFIVFPLYFIGNKVILTVYKTNKLIRNTESIRVGTKPVNEVTKKQFDQQ